MWPKLKKRYTNSYYSAHVQTAPEGKYTSYRQVMLYIASSSYSDIFSLLDQIMHSDTTCTCHVHTGSD